MDKIVHRFQLGDFVRITSGILPTAGIARYKIVGRKWLNGKPYYILLNGGHGYSVFEHRLELAETVGAMTPEEWFQRKINNG